MSAPKFCKDCKWSRAKPTYGLFGRYGDEWICRYPITSPPDLVTGEVSVEKERACDLFRTLDFFGCGKDARYFEPKEAKP